MLVNVRKIPKKSSKLLRFQCSGCGNCCIDTIVGVTHRDMARLAEYTGKSPMEFTKLYAPGEILCEDDDPMWVTMSSGRRMVGLRKKPGAETCQYLDEEKRCLVYKARPRSCRVFPLQMDDDSGKKPKVCLQDSATGETVVCHGDFTAPEPSKKWIKQLRKESDEVDEYAELIEQWHEVKSNRTKEQLFKYLGLI